MNRRVLILSMLSWMLALAPAQAEETLQSSRSAGKLRQDQQTDLSAELERSEAIVRIKPTEAEDYASSTQARQFDGVANRHDQLFEIYTADVRLIADLDGDGYHHALLVSFDVDVNYQDADVYAKLYLSREGEPWGQYFTTGLFHIHGDSDEDVYEVETELLEGYYPGYYAVLIEIYSLDHAYMVASQVLDYYTLGRDLPLESLDRDEIYTATYAEVEVSGHAGSAGWMLALFLFIQVVIAARGALAHSPLQKAIKVKLKRLP
jgi:hypothetical protein